MADACRVAPEQETREAASGCHPKPRGAKAYFPTSLHPGPRRLVGGGRGHGGLRDGGLHLTGALIDSGYQLAAIIGEDRGGFLGAGYADIETLLIDEIGRLAVGMDHDMIGGAALGCKGGVHIRSEEHTSELQSLMRNSYAVFCLNKKKNTKNTEQD